MIKGNKTKIILSCIVMLLPMLFGILSWNKLPAEIATHWGADGEPNGWSSKAFVVFLLPCILLAVQVLCLAFTALDPKHQNHGRKIVALVIWICPAISVISFGYIYAYAFGIDMNIERGMPLMIGLMFIVIGNYLPKCKQNYTIGIKLPWTLNNEEVWNRTHRLCGRLWVAGGIVIAMSAFLPEESMVIILTAVLAILIVVPVAYSWQLHNKLN